MRDFGFSGYGFLPFGKRIRDERELNVRKKLIERLERRFKEQQASLRFITVSTLAVALSACMEESKSRRAKGHGLDKMTKRLKHLDEEPTEASDLTAEPPLN